MKTWVKYYTETLDDPEYNLKLSWADRGIFVAMLALAGKIDDRDEDGNETGRLDTPSYVMWGIHCNQDEFEPALEKLMAQEMIEEKDGILYVSNYAKRQSRPPSDSREATRERVRAHRKKKRERNENVTPLDTDTETEQQQDTETEQQQSLVDELISCGVVVRVAKELVNKYPLKDIQERIRQFRYAKKTGKADSAGWLIRALENDWPPPRGYQSEHKEYKWFDDV